jgi:hypothetical protein
MFHQLCLFEASELISNAHSEAVRIEANLDAHLALSAKREFFRAGKLLEEPLSFFIHRCGLAALQWKERNDAA